VYHLSATYFDTADGRLAANKITLRRRTGGADEGWHLKLPGGLPSAEAYSSRLEVQLPLAAGGERDVPAAHAARVAEVTGGLPLAPIATLDTERTVVTLTSADGALLAEIADDRVTASRVPAGQPLRWREVEVEVPSESPELQQAVADRLFAAGARPAGHGSKLARLLSA
jgi:inorganic triphosphatase YgiF